MRHDRQLELIRRLQKHQEEGSTAYAPETFRNELTAYTDPARAEREREIFFRQRPLPFGLSGRLAEPGDYVTDNIDGNPLLITRDRGGVVHAFLNVCRHRGMRLVQEQGPARLRSMVCPYHQWTYGLDGELRNVPRSETFEELDMASRGLVALPCEVRGGLIWVQAEGEMDLDAHLAGLGADLDLFDMPGFQFCASNVRTVDCNWKLIQDAFLDGYHVVRLHKNTVGAFFPDSMAESDQVGDHIRSAVARNEIFDAPGLAEEALDIRHHATYSYTVFPNAVLVFHPDYTSIISLFPKSAAQTVFAHTMLPPHARKSAEETGHSARYLLPEQVESYIRSRGLYS